MCIVVNEAIKAININCNKVLEETTNEIQKLDESNFSVNVVGINNLLEKKFDNILEAHNLDKQHEVETIFKYLLSRLEEIEGKYLGNEKLHDKIKNTLKPYDFNSYVAIKSALWDISAGLVWVIKLKKFDNFEIHLHCNFSEKNQETVFFYEGIRVPVQN